ncbi:hypothetical protein [Neptuniibacter sp.]|uniref:hypothetical protein n=1 Tax=Neptuniibacter sp. TaxID=1962643 RepID=UPI00261CD1EB|nr:hypothetical protein [Neptuniibacter sp.]MCP4597029.1 hypothetical protein [Neptuniibacter sp.]
METWRFFVGAKIFCVDHTPPDLDFLTTLVDTPLTNAEIITHSRWRVVRPIATL